MRIFVKEHALKISFSYLQPFSSGFGDPFYWHGLTLTQHGYVITSVKCGVKLFLHSQTSTKKNEKEEFISYYILWLMQLLIHVGIKVKSC